jgi:uncharacterized protein
MISAYINWVVGRPWTVIIISMILVAISGIGMSKLAFRTDHRLFFAEDNPELLNFVEVEKTYTKNDNILFVVTAKNGNIFDRETMEVLLDLTAEGWTLPRVRRVDSITNFQNSRAEGDDIAIDNLVLRKADLTPEYLGEIRQTVLNEPLLVNRIDWRSGGQLLRLKGERRIGSDWKLAAEINLFVGVRDDPLLWTYREDDHAMIRLRRFF